MYVRVREPKANVVCLALRGAIAVLFGIAILVWPGISLFALTLAFGVYVLLDGALAVFAITAPHSYGVINRPALVMEGMAGIGIGALTIIWPEITVLVLLYLIAAWAFVTGVLEIMAAVRLRSAIEYEWLLGAGGVLSIVFSGLLIVYPVSGVLSILWMMAAYAVAFGCLLMLLAWRRARYA